MSADHAEPPSGAECIVCMGDIDADTYQEYKIHDTDAVWTPSRFCSGCADHLIRTQWKRFEDLIDKADCRAAVLRLCASVPLTLHDHAGFICATHGKDCEKQGSVAQLWSKSTGEVVVPYLVGAKQGEERAVFIDNLKQFAELMEADKKAELSGELKPVSD